MHITGSYTFPAPPDRVWTLLMDPAVIAGCIPGCEELTPKGEGHYHARLTVALAAITGTYDGTVVISEADPPKRYVLTVEGQGRPGFAKGTATITLRPEGDGTVVDVHGTLQTGGTIARLGQRLIGSVSKMMQDRFFGCLKTKMT
jgi:carbon monoxide dehydrogenase subunit G